MDASIFHSPTHLQMADALVNRLDRRLRTMDEAGLVELLADTVYQERLRFEEEPSPDEEPLVDAAARAVARGGRSDRVRAAHELVRAYAVEIHNPFSPRSYSAATRVLPRALTTLVSASDPRRLRGSDPARRIEVQGAVEQVKRLAQKGTVILAPTHTSNLDSPLIGYALHLVGLPPFAYGAGLNLYSNPVMSFWMRRLGTYTVDRRKQGRLYKEALKDYSVEILRRRCHSLFFPGGTRSRSGLVEKRLKKGLLGTGLAAWQENLAEKRTDGDVFIVPMTLSTSLVLEAETLIRDALAREGKQRYIITDDEFSEPRTVASFLSRVLNLDEAVHLVFCQAMDPMGNPVDEEGRSLGPDGSPIDRLGYVTDAAGKVEIDEQRDFLYTERVAERLVEAYHRDNVALPTQVSAFAAWCMLEEAWPGEDHYRLVRLDPDSRLLDRRALLLRLDRVRLAIGDLVGKDKIRASLPTDSGQILDQAMHTFSTFHTRPALEPAGPQVRVDPELLLFYRNRLVGYGLEKA